MKVTLDIQPALAQRAGIGRYTRMLAEFLALLRGNDELSLFYFDFKRKGCSFAPAGTNQKAVKWIPGRVVQRAWRTVNFPPFDWFAGKADLYHFTNFIRPPVMSGKSVVTIHDAAFLRCPETMDAKNYRYLSRCINKTIEHADAIICISAFTSSELAELTPVSKEKLHAIPLGVSSNHTRASEEAISRMRKRLQLNRPYLLSVGTLEPRKNFPFLIDVFEQLSFDGELVIAGMKGWKTDGIFERRSKSPLRDRIKLLEYVDEQDMAALYSGADLYVTPSLYEGFGFTPLEAMQCETPVVSSTGGSLPEVLGDAARMIDSFDIDAWTGGIEELLSDSTVRKNLAGKGLERVRLYTWENTAQKTWDVYRSIAQ